jgi:hypothetical protein
MRVILATHGGLAAAITRRLPPRVVDTEQLPPSSEAELRELLAGVVSAPRAESAPDAMSYTITVEDGDESTTLTASDTTMSPAFAALLNWIQTQSE